MRKTTITFAAILATASIAQASNMAEMDANADGALSVEEFTAGHEGVDPAVFTEVDTNEDGLIDPSEYDAATAEDGVLAKS